MSKQARYGRVASRRLAAVIAMSVVLFSGAAFADQQISVVDVQKVITASKAGQRARQEVEAEVKRGESRVSALKGEFESLEKSMQKQAELLSGVALEEKQGELRKKERALRVALEDQRDAIARKNRSEVGKVVGKIDGIIKELGASGKYGVILDANPQLVLYYDKAIDISDVVVAKLDERS